MLEGGDAFTLLRSGCSMTRVDQFTQQRRWPSVTLSPFTNGLRAPGCLFYRVSGLNCSIGSKVGFKWL